MTWTTPRTVLLVVIFAALSAVDSSVGSAALRLPIADGSSNSYSPSHATADSSTVSGIGVDALSSSTTGNKKSCSIGALLRRLTGAGVSEDNGASGWWLGWAWGADATVSVVDRAPPVALAARPASFGRVLEDPVMGYGIPLNSFTVPCEDIGDGADDENVGGNRGRQANRGTGSRRVWALVSSQKENLGCAHLCPAGAHMPSPEEAWIAIVQRGRCSFVEKVSRHCVSGPLAYLLCV